MPSPKTVTAYIAAAPPATRPMLRQLRAAIKAAAPKATERISYAIPFYEYKSPGYAGRLVYFAAFVKHVGMYIVPKKLPAALARTITPYRSGRSTLQFPVGTKIPMAAVKRLVRIRMREIDQLLKAVPKTTR